MNAELEACNGAAEMLPASGLLSALDPDDRMALATLGEFAEIPPKLDIVTQDTRQESLFVLVSGRARVLRDTPGGEASLADLRPGELFGEVSILDSRPASATVRAVEPCTVWQIGRAAFDRFLAERPQAGHRLLIEIARVLGRRLRAANQRIEPAPGDVLGGWW